MLTLGTDHLISGGVGFFLATSYFPLFLHSNLFFSKVNCNMVSS